MFFMLVVGYLSLIDVFKSKLHLLKVLSMSVHLVTNNDLKRNMLGEKNCKFVKILTIKETKERTLKFELREYVNDFQI